jgi:hypothetical protein
MGKKGLRTFFSRSKSGVCIIFFFRGADFSRIIIIISHRMHLNSETQECTEEIFMTSDMLHNYPVDQFDIFSIWSRSVKNYYYYYSAGERSVGKKRSTYLLLPE